MYFEKKENKIKHSGVMKAKANTSKARDAYVSKGIASLPETKKAVFEGMKKYHNNNPGVLKEYYANNESARKAISDKVKAYNTDNPDAREQNAERARAQFADPLNKIRCRLAAATGHAKKAGRPFSIVIYTKLIKPPNGGMLVSRTG